MNDNRDLTSQEVTFLVYLQKGHTIESAFSEAFRGKVPMSPKAVLRVIVLKLSGLANDLDKEQWRDGGLP